MVDIHFTELETPSHIVIPISATISTPDGKLYGDSTTGHLAQPDSSNKAMIGQLNSEKGAFSDDEQGRMYLFQEAAFDTPKKLVDKQEKQVVVGVGDILQLKVDQPISVNIPPTSP